MSRMLLSELYEIMVNKVTFVGFKGGDRPNHPHWIRPWTAENGQPAQWRSFCEWVIHELTTEDLNILS